jgi:hypothetical protein
MIKTQMKNAVPERIGTDLIPMGRFNLQVRDLLIEIVMRHWHPEIELHCSGRDFLHQPRIFNRQRTSLRGACLKNRSGRER